MNSNENELFEEFSAAVSPSRDFANFIEQHTVRAEKAATYAIQK